VTNTPNRRYSSLDTGGSRPAGGRHGQGGKAISTVTAAPALRRDGEDISDSSLVTRVRAGDDRAFETLYTRYHRRIASYVQGMVHDYARAEDISQDVFMSALRRMRETDRSIAFKPWIYEIAKNACIDQFRRSRRAEEVSMDADEGLGSADYGRLVSAGPTPEAAVDHKQQLDHLCGAFGGLSETHHEILVMRELEGLSYREIGEKLGMTRPAVESTLFRARRRLTEEYDQLITGERCVRVQAIIASAGGSALGARDRRRVARHVSYCQPCLRHARMSGIDAADLVHRPLRQKIAALLPLPAFIRERFAASSADAQVSLANWSAQASAIDPGVISTWGKAAATAATIVVAGAGVGVATDSADKLRGSLGGAAVNVLTGDDANGSSGSGSSSGDARRAVSGGGSVAGSGSPAVGGKATTKGSKGTSADRSAARDGRGFASTTGATAQRDGGGGGATTTAAGETTEPSTTTQTDPGGELRRLLPAGGQASSGGEQTDGTSTSDGGDAPIVAPSVQLPSVEAPATTGGSAEETKEDPVQGIIDRATGSLGGLGGG
jgi:RNA polymerase sigma factor (sigma-70 family)